MLTLRFGNDSHLFGQNAMNLMTPNAPTHRITEDEAMRLAHEGTTPTVEVRGQSYAVNFLLL